MYKSNDGQKKRQINWRYWVVYDDFNKEMVLTFKMPYIIGQVY